MLASHNILNPKEMVLQLCVPSQDMVLGLYYITKARKSDKERTMLGEGKVFYSPEEVTIAYNEGKVNLHSEIKVIIEHVKERSSSHNVWSSIVQRSCSI
ncbi:MAG: hypothetical protein R2813_07115 [Flavobacteriales bacterium]